ncbi:TetR/AcrR family transcriptional regulator [Streptomyces sp. JV176]|uniref:TetR/AcrR family transcriptional regulator n=1 Tax=Streptomyces sp. JV176 TaxID=858630 RepID=UPI002E77AE49|nr:TetR/AcrR family transcriptional regulator [Streptomyces sp. JV176]MEE1800386.1 TetR/AcrR family transcriptional regulator [Streptomyces sp. JV176]
MADSADSAAEGGGTGLPASIEAAWGLRDRPAKGPRPGLTLERIVGAAVGVAAAEGLGAVSMGRVAKELGVSTMSLYRYVAAKDELYILMLEEAIGAPPPPPDPALGWREALTRWAWGQREAFHRNLWSLRLPISGPPSTPHMVAWWERGMVALDGTGLDDRTRIAVILLVSGFVRNEAMLMADLDAAVGASGASAQEVMAGYGRTLRRLADPARYPSVARLLAEGGLEGEEEPDADFTFGLDCLLDGVEALIRRRAAGG